MSLPVLQAVRLARGSSARSLCVHAITARLPTSTVTSARRHFSGTRAARASEDEDSFIHRLQQGNMSLFRQLADKPEALQAIGEMAKLLQSKGIDLTSRPSMGTLWKLASDPDIMQAARKAQETLNSAGVKLDAREFLSMVRDLPSSKKD